MDRIAFADGEKIGVYDGGNVTYYECEAIVRFRDYLSTREKSDEWKFGGEGARFRGDYDFFRQKGELYASVNGVAFTDGVVTYSYSVNGNSGIYQRTIGEERERHLFTSSEEEILSIGGGGKRFAVTVQGKSPSSSVGVLDVDASELRSYTAGDSLDKNPFLCAEGIYFDTAGLGRDIRGDFTGKYAPASICRLDQNAMEIEEIRKSDKFGYIKPKIAPDGTLYYIRRPAKEKTGNPFLEMLMIPIRIVQAIVMFVQSFVIAFTGKSLTSGGENPARGRETDSRKIFVEGNMIEAEKELRRARRAKEKWYGFIPRSWKLIRYRDGKEEIVADGVCDYCFLSDGAICGTNGRHLLRFEGGKTERLCDCEKCLSLCAETRAEQISSDPLFL